MYSPLKHKCVITVKIGTLTFYHVFIRKRRRIVDMPNSFEIQAQNSQTRRNCPKRDINQGTTFRQINLVREKLRGASSNQEQIRLLALTPGLWSHFLWRKSKTLLKLLDFFRMKFSQIILAFLTLLRAVVMPRTRFEKLSQNLQADNRKGSVSIFAKRHHAGKPASIVRMCSATNVFC